MKVSTESISSRAIIEVQRPDEDGDVFMDATDAGCYFTVPSVRRLINALEWAIRGDNKKKKRQPAVPDGSRLVKQIRQWLMRPLGCDLPFMDDPEGFDKAVLLLRAAAAAIDTKDRHIAYLQHELTKQSSMMGRHGHD